MFIKLFTPLNFVYVQMSLKKENSKIPIISYERIIS